MSNVRQVEEMFVGTTLGTANSVSTFITSAANGALQVFNADGSELTEVKGDVKVYKKTNDPLNATGYDFSVNINPKNISRITLKKFEAARKRKITAKVDIASPDTTYILDIRIYNPAGALSVENFNIVSGYYVTGKNSNDTVDVIAQGLLDSLEGNLKRRGDYEFTVTKGASGTISIEGKDQAVIPGKFDGKPVEFDINVRSYDNTVSPTNSTGLMSMTINEPGYNGSGTGREAVNREWFIKGFEYDVYRGTAYPADLTPPYYASVTGEYDVLIVNHFKSRISPTVEVQNQSISFYVPKNTIAEDLLATFEALKAGAFPAVGGGGD